MNIIDIILGIFLLLGLLRGFYRGFLLELAGLVALFAGIYGAIYFSDETLAFLQSFIEWEEEYLRLIAFALTFLLIVIAISIVGRILTKMVNMLFLGLLNRFLGGIFGLLKMAFLASLLFMFLNYSESMSIGEEHKEGSVLYPPVEKIAPMVLPTILTKLNEEGIFDEEMEEEKAE